MPLAEVKRLPVGNLANIPEMLRSMADDVENGEFGDCHNIAWVADVGDGVVTIGMMGQSAEPGCLAHYLFALGMRKLEEIA